MRSNVRIALGKDAVAEIFADVDDVREGGIPQGLGGEIGHAEGLKAHGAAVADACPVAAITPNDDGKMVIDAEKCISCGTCQAVCPVGAPVSE